MNRYLQAFTDHRAAAEQALAEFRDMCDIPVPRVPGMDTIIRLAWRIECGRTPTEAAAREYLYRVNLALTQSFSDPTTECGSRNPLVSINGTPCLLGL
jgi:hypothetical protein